MTLVDLLLRDRKTLLDKIEEGDDLKTIAKTMLVTAAFSACIFGGCLGAFRGGWQIPFGAFKLPLVVLLTACIAAPSLTALGRALSGSSSAVRDFALVLASLALATLVAAALAPGVMLAKFLGCSY